MMSFSASFAPVSVDRISGATAIQILKRVIKIVATNLSLHFLEDTLGWVAVILMVIVLRFTDWYILDPLLSLVISIFYSVKGYSMFLEHAQDFPGYCARRSGYPEDQDGFDRVGPCR